ncbi:MAG TPA: MarR family transcriptional regulator [Lactobacillaceae bacterium]
MSEEKILLQGAIKIYLSALKHLETVVSQPTSIYGLSFEQYLLLNTLAESDVPLNLTEIARQRDVTKGAIARQIKLLEQRGFVQQVVSENDRRRMDLMLTTKGVEVEMGARGEVEARFAEWIDTFGLAKSHQLLAVLNEFDTQIVAPLLKKHEQTTKTD